MTEPLTLGRWNMLAIAVQPSNHARGLGTQLVEALEADLEKRAVRILIADTSGTDAFRKTRRLYANNRYREEARIHDFWDQGDDKVTFLKQL